MTDAPDPIAPPEGLIPSSSPMWWLDGFIYQVYPRSFADGNGDGIGDLEGVVARIGHIARLGASAVWLSPIYPSGGVDGGYDVTDYRAVDPTYGDLDGFDRLVSAAHAVGLRVLLDFVPNHTSDCHPWFLESRASRDSPKRDWYVWADGRHGGPPNNWVSTFSGSAWIPDHATGQFYLASFYPQQPDLNWENSAVRAEVTGAMRFWVDRGVDGFRIDVIHKLSKDPLLRDNPAGSEDGEELPPGRRRRDENGPRALEFVDEIRRAVGPSTYLLGEVWLLDLDEVYRYVGADLLDQAFNFPFALSPWNPRPMQEVIEQTERLTTGSEDAWPSYHLANHDMPRVGTRYGPQAIRPAAVLQLTLRGTPVIYQGDEIGMVDGDVPEGRRVDQVGRDGCRTPMQWDGTVHAGFCPPTVEPWLPVAGNHTTVNVAAQEDDPNSVLGLYRRVLAVRAFSPALRTGRYGPVGASRNVLAYTREEAEDRYLVAVNFGQGAADLPVAAGGAVVVATDRSREGERVTGTCPLAEFEAVVIVLDRPERGPVPG